MSAAGLICIAYLAPVGPELERMAHAQHVRQGASTSLAGSFHAGLAVLALHHKRLHRCAELAKAVAGGTANPVTARLNA